MLQIKLKAIEHMQGNLKANMLYLHRPATPWVGSKGHFVFFSKRGHVAYQIKVEEV